MSDILHKIRVKAPRARVYEALSTVDGLSKWWTKTTSGTSAPGGVIEFRFGEHVTKMRVDAHEAGQKVAWTCVQATPDWMDTRVTFDLAEDNGDTVVRFGHRGWREANDFYAHCSMKWATFLLSLKKLGETGQGAPFPDDLTI